MMIGCWLAWERGEGGARSPSMVSSSFSSPSSSSSPAHVRAVGAAFRCARALNNEESSAGFTQNRDGAKNGHPFFAF
jgi:hypothetical protein